MAGCVGGMQGDCSFLVCMFSVRNLEWLRIVQAAVGSGHRIGK